MTDLDRQYMVDVDDANLRAFLAWHDDARKRGVLDISLYALLKMCWMAAKNTPREPELAPSRDVLPPAPVKKDMLRARPEGPYDGLRPVGRQQVAYWPQQSPDRHREAQRYVETQAMPALTDDPFANVRLSGPQQAAMDSLYPEPGFATLDMPVTMREMPVVGAVESVSEHRRQQMASRYAGLSDYGPPGPVMTPLQALPEPDDGS